MRYSEESTSENIKNFPEWKKYIEEGINPVPEVTDPNEKLPSTSSPNIETMENQEISTNENEKFYPEYRKKAKEDKNYKSDREKIMTALDYHLRPETERLYTKLSGSHRARTIRKSKEN